MTLLSPGTILLLLGVTLLVGAVLHIIGWCGRWIGDAPHCRVCGQNLTGVTSPQCPECGKPISPESVVIGQRQRYRGVLLIAARLTLVSLSGFAVIGYGHFKTINWYTHYPVSTLVRLGHRADLKAIAELVDRFKNNRIPPAKLPTAIDTALADHRSTTSLAHARAWADLLVVFDKSIGLLPQQRDIFYSRVAPPTLKVRTPIKRGDNAVIGLEHERRGSPLLNTLWESVLEVRIGSDPPFEPRFSWNGVYSSAGARGYHTLGIPGPQKSVGDVEIQCRILRGLFAAASDPDSSEPLWSETFTLAAIVEVLPDDGPEPIRLVKDTALQSSLQSDIEIVRVTRSSSWVGDVNILIDLKQPAPMCLAFEVIVWSQGEGRPHGHVVWRTGEDGLDFATDSHNSSQVEPSFEDVSEVTIELRPSYEAAKVTLNCYEIWDGKLKFGPIPIEEK